MMKTVDVNAVFIREAKHRHSLIMGNPNSNTRLTSHIKQNYCILQEIITSRDYDMTKGGITTKASAYAD